MIATSIDWQLVYLSYRTRAGFNRNGANAFRRPRPAIGFKPAIPGTGRSDQSRRADGANWGGRAIKAAKLPRAKAKTNTENARV